MKPSRTILTIPAEVGHMPVGTIDVRERSHDRSDRVAHAVRRRLEEARTVAFNLISAPGAGKTLLLERTLEALNMELNIAVITGGCDPREDAERLARHTGRLVQSVLTHDGSHLDASQVGKALDAIDLDYTDLLLIENVGNLICPALWDLGEESKVVLYSVTDGEHAPLKYPQAFRGAAYGVITKLDLLPHVDFRLDRAIANARDVNPQLQFFFTSARTGEGMQDWCDFLRARVAEVCIPVE